MMRKISVLIIAIILSSCNNDDDNSSVENQFFSADLTKSFLLHEKWFLESATALDPIDFNGDGNSSTDLKSQADPCVLDDFYIFEQFQSDLVVINDSDNMCDDYDDKYGAGVFDFKVFDESRRLELDVGESDLLGGFKDVIFFNDVEFLISKDSEFKLIKGKVRTIINEEVMNINYSLIAYSNDRP